jgi:hypothetical protein
VAVVDHEASQIRSGFRPAWFIFSMASSHLLFVPELVPVGSDN